MRVVAPLFAVVGKIVPDDEEDETETVQLAGPTISPPARKDLPMMTPEQLAIMKTTIPPSEVAAFHAHLADQAARAALSGGGGELDLAQLEICRNMRIDPVEFASFLKKESQRVALAGGR